MLADQVVHPVPARGRLYQQILLIECLQAVTGKDEAGTVQGGGGVAVDVGTWMQPKPAEQALLVEGSGLRRTSRAQR